MKYSLKPRRNQLPDSIAPLVPIYRLAIAGKRVRLRASEWKHKQAYLWQRLADGRAGIVKFGYKDWGQWPLELGLLKFYSLADNETVIVELKTAKSDWPLVDFPAPGESTKQSPHVEETAEEFALRQQLEGGAK